MLVPPMMVAVVVMMVVSMTMMMVMTVVLMIGVVVMGIVDPLGIRGMSRATKDQGRQWRER